MKSSSAKRARSTSPKHDRASEENVQKFLVMYLDISYKDWIYQMNYLSGAKLPIGLASKAKTLGHRKSIPDVMIFEPRGEYHGLFIELKRECTRIRKSDDSGFANEHIERQAAMLDRLTKKGYKAVFGCGIDEAMEIVNEYAKLQPAYK